MKLYNPNYETELHTDASSFGYGACLMQRHIDAQMHPVFYISYKTKDSESRFASYELEVLAIVRALKKLRIYLLGIKFKIYTDCKSFETDYEKKRLMYASGKMDAIIK